MLIKDIFKNLFTYSNKQNPIWNLEFNFKEETIQFIEYLFQKELMFLFNIHRASEKVVPIIHLHFDDIISMKEQSLDLSQKEIFSYLQFTWGICGTTQLNEDGEFIYCYEIFMKSIFDRSYKNGEEYDLSKAAKPYSFLESNNTYLADSKSVIEQWFSQLYYYSKSFSGLNDWCKYFFPEVYYRLSEGFSIEFYHPQFLSNLLLWCEINFHFAESRAIRTIIEREYSIITWSGDIEANKIKHLLGFQILLSRMHNNEGKNDLYKELELNFGFNPFSKMQAISALIFNGQQLVRKENTLIDSIKEYNSYLNTQNFNKIDCIYQRARMLKVLLGSSISIAVNNGRSHIIKKILSSFYAVKNPHKLDDILFIIPNQEKRVVYTFSGKSIFDEKNSQEIIVEIVDAENSALNTVRLLKGGIKQQIKSTKNPIGLPVPDKAYAYETKLLELYDFDKIKEEINHISSFCQFDFNSFPLQALMIKTIKKTIPLNLSLTNKLEFPKVEKVIYWSGFSLTSEIETIALKEIFENAKIEFEIHNEENSNKEKFIKRIKELDPDLVWISSHGEYQHYQPNSSAIILSHNEDLTIREYELLINKSLKRRLVLLNVCEGGVHCQTGEFKNLGFPNLLTSENQDVISHLWMAEPRCAYVFGAFIALGIASLKKTFFEAFEYSLSNVLSDKDSLLKEINSYPLKLTDLKERIQNNDGTDWGNIISTGSPVYHI